MAAQKAQILYRDRTKTGEGKKAPRFKLVAVSGLDLKIYAKHVRRQELEHIASCTGAELVLLQIDKKGCRHDVEMSE